MVERQYTLTMRVTLWMKMVQILFALIFTAGTFFTLFVIFFRILRLLVHTPDSCRFCVYVLGKCIFYY